MNNKRRTRNTDAEVIVVGGGLAGLSAAIYLARSKRDTLIVDNDKSMARWEPDVENYLGFPDGTKGSSLLSRGRKHAHRYGARLVHDRIDAATKTKNGFSLRGAKKIYHCSRLLLATGIFHIPPDIPGIRPCLGKSLFFCKDCDGYRVQGQDVAIYGWTNEAVEYALAMLSYSPCVFVMTDGRAPRWNAKHARWLREYEIPVYPQPIKNVRRAGGQVQLLHLADGTALCVAALFTTRGDIYYNKLARNLGARVDREGQIITDLNMKTTVEGLYAAGCVTPANCQMIIAAGQGATAAQAINKDLFRQSLATHTLRRLRRRQLQTAKTGPVRKFKQQHRPKSGRTA